MPTLELTVSCTAAKYWVAVDDKDVIDTTSFGSIPIPAGDHTLIWWMTGQAGDTLSLTGVNGATTVVTVPSTAIPAGSLHLADYKFFTI